MQLPVPYFEQETRWSCAVACLEMVAQFHGCAGGGFNQVALYEKLKRPVVGQKGQWCVYNDALMREAQALGLTAQGINLNFTSVPDMMQAIRHFTENLGLPLIAAQRAAMLSPLGHSRVIVGWEPPQSGEDMPFVVFHDPAAARFAQAGSPPGGASRKWKADVFARMWKPNAATVSGGAAIVLQKRLGVV